MENKFNIKPMSESLTGSSKTWKYRRSVIALLIGGVAGLIYYYFLKGPGTGGVAGNPFLSAITGGLLGLFVANSPCAQNKC
jgi:hypothetical protein